MDAASNETKTKLLFEDNVWYRVLIRVDGLRVVAFIDEKKMVDVNLAGKKIGLRPGEIELSKPLGLATFRTEAAFRNLKIRELE